MGCKRKSVNTNLTVPVIYYTQLVGLSIGMSDEELGFELNRIPLKWASG